MTKKKKIMVIMPAYNTSATLEKTVREIPKEEIDEIVLIDDASTDSTAELARQLGLTVLQHSLNRGYGGSQKTGYRYALDHDAEIVVMVHSDYQYDPTLVPKFIEMIASGKADGVTGSRILSKDTLQGGMPIWKYLPNRLLTFIGNKAFKTNLSELHNGYRAYSREVLASIPFEQFSEKFDFDTEIIIQMVIHGFKMGEIPNPTRFLEDSSMMSFRDGIVYSLNLLKHMFLYWLHRIGLVKSEKYNISDSH